MPTVHFTASPELQQDPTAYHAAEAATEQLRQQPGPDELFAEWDVAPDRRAVALTLRLPPVAVSTTYRPAELVTPRGWMWMNEAYRGVLLENIRRRLGNLMATPDDPAAAPEEQLARAQ